MQQDFDREVLSRLPLADAVLSLWQWVCAEEHLDNIFGRHRGACYEKKIRFPTMVQLVRDALLEHDGSAHQSFRAAREDHQLTAAISSAYAKLGHLPLGVSAAFLAEGTDRLRQLFPGGLEDPVPPSLRSFQVHVLDGKAVKRVPKRLKPARGRKGGLLGGKALVALHLSTGLAVALAPHSDGEVNDAKLIPDLLPVVRARAAGPRLWVADRQFCDLKQTAAFTADGDHFLVRYHPKPQFCPDPARAPRAGQDAQGRRYQEEWGWLGREANPARRYVRRITLERPGEEAVILVTDLLDAAQYPAEDLLSLYLARWGIERVFQQITEVFHLRGLIATTPEGTLFQLSFCLLLYNMIQVVRAYVASAQGRAAESISVELLFEDVTKQVVALGELVEGERVVELLSPTLSPTPTAAALCARLRALLAPLWSERWLKAPKRRRKPPAAKTGKRDHTSVFRLLKAHQQSKNDPPSS